MEQGTEAPPITGRKAPAPATAQLPARDLRDQTLKQHASEVLSLGYLGVSCVYSVIVALSLLFPVPWDNPLTIGVTAAVAAVAWTGWISIRTGLLPRGNAHPALFSLLLVMGLQTGTVLYLIGEPIHSGNQIMVLLSAAFFLSARPWFYATVAIVLCAWLPAALAGFANDLQRADWSQWARLLLVSTALAIAFFEARRLSVLKTFQLKLDAEAALAAAEEANRSRLTMEQMMQESQRRESLGVLAGGIAHDFNNLLAVIKGNLDLMALFPERVDDADAMIAEMRKATGRAVELTQQMLVYAGRSKPKISTVNLGERIRSAAQLIMSSIPAGIAIRLEGSDDGPQIQVDGTLLDQMIINIIQNAVDACVIGNGEVQVEWEAAQLGLAELAGYQFACVPKPGPYAMIRVNDDGIGMTSETRQRMFEPFFTGKQNGNGLGLAVVNGILQSHAAGFAVASKPGAGTEIRLALPCERQMVPPGPADE